MKIGEVKIGEHYAAHDEPTARRYGSVEHGTLPREVEVLEIVQVEERFYRSGYMREGDTSSKRKVRRVKVKVVGGVAKPSSWTREQIARAEPGATLVVEARHLIGPWKDLAPDVAKIIRLRQEREVLRDTLQARLDALLPKSRGRTSVSVSMSGGKLLPTMSVHDGDVDTLLTIAEFGAAQSRAAVGA